MSGTERPGGSGPVPDAVAAASGTGPDTPAAGTAAAAVPLAAIGRLSELDGGARSALLDRGRGTDPEVERAVSAILAEVRRDGDAALRAQALRYDGVALDELEVPRQIWTAALDALDPTVRAALEEAAAAIHAFHQAQLPPPLEVELRPGVRLGRRADPLARIGVYAPGGRAAYPSSVLMGVVPARTAGVDEVVVCSPPGPDGLPPAAVLAACALAGADRVFALGGAGAVAALAYGTDSVPAVDKVVGPGNAYVTEAKRQLAGVVASDSPAGPSEVLVVADVTADPERAAAELLAQAEHDPDAAAVLVATAPGVADAVMAALARLLPAQPRREIIARALAARGGVLTAGTLDEALAFAETYAPEHLALMVAEPRLALERVRAAGTVFLGDASSVAFGDYITGANHVLPTAGLARAYSGLSVLDFLRWTTYQEVGDDAAAALAVPTARLAEAEGLPAHALAAKLRSAPGAGGTVEGAATGSTEDIGAGAVTVTGAGGATASDAGSGAGARDRADGRSAPRTPVAAVPRRATFRDVPLYDPGRRPCAVDLSDNTNLFGMSPAAARALGALAGDAAAVTRYPAVFADRLKAELARVLAVAPENVATGCGSDDVIDSAVRAFCEPGDVVAFPEPTFSMVPLFARMNGARPAPVPLAPGFTLDAAALLAARGRVSYICRPNNPTGTAFERDAVAAVAAGTAGVVLVDEAYAEFADEDLTAWAAASDRVLSLRTLSKAYGLAGLRIGYAVGPAPLIAEVEKSRGPYKIGAAAEAAALATLREDRAWVADVVAQTRENRGRLAERIRELGFTVWPSTANFLLVRIADPDRDRRQERGNGLNEVARGAGNPPPSAAHAFAAALRSRGVAVRPFPAVPGAGECFRVTVGPWPMMERFLEALEAVAAGPPSDSREPRGS